MTLNVVVNPTYHITIDASITEGETYNENGFNESVAGTYELPLTTIHGCDSIVTLNLEVITGISTSDNPAISIYPNPAHDYTTLNINGLESVSEITLTDMCGRVVRSYIANKGDNEILIEKGSISAGVYVLRLTNGEKSLVEKVTFQ